MTMFRVTVVALVFGVATDAAKAGPDPPFGRYGIGIRNNVEVPLNENVPEGQPLVYVDLVELPNGQMVWGLTVHGWVDLPAPNAGGNSWWAVVHSTTEEATLGGQSSVPTESFGPIAWTGKVTKGHWAMTVVPAWDQQIGFFAGSFISHFDLKINSPGTGGWMYPLVNCQAFFAW